MDDESHRSKLLRRSLIWDAGLSRSEWPEPPNSWTEENAAKIRRNHGLAADARLIPISKHGADLDERYRGFDLLIIGSPCNPGSLEELEEIGVPRLAVTPQGRELAVWLTRIELPGNPLRIEQRVSLRGDFI